MTFADKLRALTSSTYIVETVWPRVKDDFSRHRSLYLSEQYSLLLLCNQNHEIVCSFSKLKNNQELIAPIIDKLIAVAEAADVCFKLKHGIPNEEIMAALHKFENALSELRALTESEGT